MIKQLPVVPPAETARKSGMIAPLLSVLGVLICLALVSAGAIAPALAQKGSDSAQSGAEPRSGQDQAPDEQRGGPQSEKPPLDKTPNAAPSRKGQAAAQAKPTDPVSRARSGDLPNSPAARTALLQDLYALLATAEDEAAAKKVTGAVERVWAHSGSATVAVLMQRAMKAMAQNNNELAEQMFDAVVDLAPDYAEGWNRRAYFFYKRNEVTRAAGDLRRALALDPNHFRALEGLAAILRDGGDEKRAFQAFEKLLEINPLGPGVQKAYDELKTKVKGRGI